MNDGVFPIRPGSLRDTVLPTLRRAILNGEIRPGTRLTETEIARALHVSRAPVREALAHLEQEGLVERYPNRGSFVAEIYSRRAVGELASLRSTLESFAVQLALARIGPEEYAALDRYVAEMADAVARRDFAAISEADYHFHRTLVAAAGHQRLLQMWSVLAAQYWALYLPKIQSFEADIDNWSHNHRAIADALRAGRLDLTTMYLQFNILNSAEHLWLALPEQSADEQTATAAPVTPLRDAVNGAASVRPARDVGA